jgi:hypothetical protein
MKWIVLGLLFANSLFADTSKIIPTFLEASRLYVNGEAGLYAAPSIRAALAVLEKNKIDPAILEKRIYGKSSDWPLRADDKYDSWVKNPDKIITEVPELAVHAFRFKANRISDTWFRDDVYVYFFMTDGVIPTGKVTSIYKGLSSGQSFFFNEVDRAIFPLVGVPAKRPENHLIIDYGIIESDGDDIKEMQKLSSIIIDIAIAVYSTYDPQNAQILVNLRKEIKALADLLLSLNNDDRMAEGSIAWKAKELEELLRDETFVEITKRHHSKAEFNKFDYELSFRLLRK